VPAKYEALLRQGYSKGSAARITNAQAKPGESIVSPHGEGYKKKRSNVVGALMKRKRGGY